jgi:hypothetical protein
MIGGLVFAVFLAIIWLNFYQRENTILADAEQSSVNKELVDREPTSLDEGGENQSTNPEKTGERPAMASAVDDEQAVSAKKVPAASALNSTSFASEDHLNSSFLTKNDEVIQGAITGVLENENMSNFITSVAGMERGNHALSRENKLQQLLVDSKLQMYQESYACAGRVCGIQLTTAAQTSDAELIKLHQFGTNYSFYNITQDEHGNKVLKAVFIETDDASKLTLAN